jgi:hypothetical protein
MDSFPWLCEQIARGEISRRIGSADFLPVSQMRENLVKDRPGKHTETQETILVLQI